MKAERKYLIIALIFGLFTVFLFSIYLNNLERTVPDAVNYKEVVVARVTIPAHSIITGEMLELAALPEAALHPDALLDKEEAVGSVARSEIISGEQILSGRVVVDVEAAYFSYRVPEGMRAVSLPVGAAGGVAGFISPGDKVDVMVTYQRRDAEQEAVTHTVLQNVMVLAAGANYRNKIDDEPREAGTVTLAVTPGQASAVAFASQGGTFHLALRAPYDEAEVELEEYRYENID